MKLKDNPLLNADLSKITVIDQSSRAVDRGITALIKKATYHVPTAESDPSMTHYH